jgi:hypothetical protein
MGKTGCRTGLGFFNTPKNRAVIAFARPLAGAAAVAYLGFSRLAAMKTATAPTA